LSVLLQALLLDIPEMLESERLVLRAARAGQGIAVNAAIAESHAELRPWMPWARTLVPPEETEKYCREAQAKWHAREMLDFCFFAKDGGDVVGKGGLHTIDWAIPKFEIGYWVRTSRAGRGFATEATLALVELARSVLGARRIEITSDARNHASRRVAEKSGFVLEGIRRQSRRDADGHLADSCMYARTF
jgi:RimJ/RimL family protein N-acetyltransferase